MTTQNDWEVRFNDRFLNNWGTLLDIKHFIRKELADARREGHELGRSESVEFEVDKERKEERERIADLIDFAREDVCFEHKCVSSKEAFLATLREEETK